MTADIVYFSATGNTEKVVRAVAVGMDIPCNFIDLSLPSQRRNLPSGRAEILVLGTPVHCGRVPDFIYDAFSTLQGNWKFFVGIATFGNVDVGKTLYDLAVIGKDKKTRSVGYAAFVGEHSFSNEALPISVGRPNKIDLEQAKRFGKYAVWNAQNRVEVKCNNYTKVDYNLRPKPPKTPSLNLLAKKPSIVGSCINCGSCVLVCPMGAIDSNTLEVNNKTCIRCYACVKTCPCHARQSGIRWCVVRKAFQKITAEQKDNIVIV